MNAKFTRFRKRLQLADGPVTLAPGDQIQVRHRTIVAATGEILTDRLLVDDVVTDCRTYDEVAIFDAEVDGRYALGGLLIEAKK